MFRNMFDKLFKTSSHPIGLEIGYDFVRMIQLSPAGQELRVEAAEMEPMDQQLTFGSPAQQEAATAAIKEMLDRGRFTGRQVVSCLPGDSLKIKSLRLDTSEAEQIEQIMFSDVAQKFGLDPEKDEIRYLLAGNVYQGEEIKNEVIFFGMDRDHLAANMNIFEKAGLEPVAIDAMPCALFRSFQRTLRRREDHEVVSVLLDLGGRFTTVIIGRGQKIAFVKQIPIAGEHLNQKVAEGLGISLEEAIGLSCKLQDPEISQIDSFTQRAVLDAMNSTVENLAREISLCFKYYSVTFRGQRPTEAVFAGGGMYESALMEALKRQLNVEIRVAEPLRGFDLSVASIDRRPNPQMCEWAVSVGLALKGCEIQNDPQPKEEACKVNV